ncbi:MAG: multidrug effflux MFS transporter [Pseudomonadota bacterium]
MGDGQKGSEGDDFALSMTAFVSMMAFLMALTAFSVDIMLPVLPHIVDTYALDDPNMQQHMVTAYMGAFALGHIFAGPLSDRIGRRPAILLGLGIYLAGTAYSVIADSFMALLIARAVQGFGAAAPRVVAVAVVRDRFVGRAMSQVLSFIMMVFIMLPVVAPAIGAGIGYIGGWRAVFAFLFVFGATTFTWVALKLPETNPRKGPNARPAIPIATAVRTVVGNPQTMGYMVAQGFVFGYLMTYISTTQQVFEDIYGIVEWFPLVFASVAGPMILSSLVNARLVEEVGMRWLSHAAALALLGMSVVAAVILLANGSLAFAALLGFLCFAFFLIGLILPNFNALAMEPLGAVAGTGSSFVGFVMTALGAALGSVVGQLYDETLQPIIFGFVLYSAIVVLVIALTERGKLMQPTVKLAER